MARHRLRIAELIAASNSFWFGAWIVQPNLRSVGYGVRVLFAPEWVWGFLPVLAGLLLFVSVWRGWYWGRLIGALLSMIFFVGVAIVFLLTEGRLGAIPLYIHAAAFYGLLAMAEATDSGARKDG